MKKVFVTCLMLVLAASMVTTLEAVTLQDGVNAAKFIDYTSIFNDEEPFDVPPYIAPPGDNQTFAPIDHPGGAAVVAIPEGAENRAIFNVTTIALDGAFDPDFTGISTVEQLSGLFYDVHSLSTVAPPAAGDSATINYGSLGRNPVSGAPTGTGGVIEIYLDDAGVVSPFNPLATDALGTGPTAWDESDSLGLASVAGRDSFPTVNQDGEELWLQLVFIPFPGSTGGGSVPAGTFVRETFETSDGGVTTGLGSGYAMLVGGSYAGNIILGSQNTRWANEAGVALPAGFRADFFIQFDIDPDSSVPAVGPGEWLARSDDPARFEVGSVIPEPFTMVGLLIGGGSLTGYLRRRRLA